MGSYQYVQPSSHACYLNTAASSAITNTANETAFDQFFTFPSQSQRYLVPPPLLLRMQAYGLVSTGLINLGMRLRVRWGGVSGSVLLDTGTLTLAGSLSNSGWQCEAACLITTSSASGQLEAQGYGSFSAGPLSVAALQMANAGPVATDFTTTNDVVITWQWATAATANSAQLRVGFSILDGPNTQ